MTSQNQTKMRSTSASKNVPGNLQTRRSEKAPEKKIADDEFMAAAIGDVEWLRQSLRGNKGKVNFDKNGLAPIHLASIHGRIECLKLLIEKFKVDVNLGSATGWRPVHLCISNQTGKRSFFCLSYLLQQGANPSICNDDGITPMHQAASEGHVQCLKALMEVNAKIDGVDHRGHTPIDLAKLWGHRKCARLLAAEQWHQDKSFLSKEMAQLHKVKMHQVMQEIEADEELKAEQQFYGDMAFNQWLKERGLPAKSTGPGNKEVTSSEASSSSSKKPAPQQALYRANSLQNKTSGCHKKSVPSPISEEERSPQRRPTEPGIHYSSDMTRVITGHTPNESTPVESEQKMPEGFYITEEWNKSTKLMKDRSPYVPLLPDHYPRDEYTMRPKFPPKRHDKSPTLQSAQMKTGATSVNKHSQEGPRMPQLPQDVINRTLDPDKHERPVVYKCKHIADTHKKKLYDWEELPRSEAGMHLTNDKNSILFKIGLQPEKLPRTGRTRTTGISDSGSCKDDMDLPQMMNMLHRMKKPTHYPNIKGPEFDLNLGQVAGI